MEGPNYSRQEIIAGVLRDLEELKIRGSFPNIYALNENIIFFKSLRSYGSCLNWFLFRRSQIDASRLLEISDLPLQNPRWERLLQEELLVTEKRQRMNIVCDLRDEIIRHINSQQNLNKRLVILNLGCGAMEVERQIIEKLVSGNNHNSIVFIGIDNSHLAVERALKNLKKYDIKSLGLQSFKAHFPDDEQRFGKGRYTVLVVKSEIEDFLPIVPEKYVDICFSCRFQHHLGQSKQQWLEKVLSVKAKVVIEADDINGWFTNVMSVMFNWNKPILLNGAIFSCLRDPSKQELRQMSRAEWKTIIFSHGYLRISQR